MIVENMYWAMGCQNKQWEVLMYIIEHTDIETKLFTRTYNQIEQDVQVSQATIAKVFKKLQDNHFIERKGNLGWVVKIRLEPCAAPSPSGYYFRSLGR